MYLFKKLLEDSYFVFINILGIRRYLKLSEDTYVDTFRHTDIFKICS